MDTLYNQTNKIIQQTHYSFQHLEHNPNNASEAEAEIQRQIDLINE